MTAARPVPTRLVPTLTEVVELGSDSAVESSTLQMTPPGSLEVPPLSELPEPPAAAALPEPVAAPALPDADRLTERVLADVQQRVEEVLEDRLLQVLTPALLKLGEAWAAETRNELAATLRAIVAEAVAEEMSRHRDRR
jgi:hypothetical protein